MTYDDALNSIAALHRRKWRNGLDRMEAFLRIAQLEAAVAKPRFVHVAGTNGKGSVTAYIESIFRADGKSSGAFFSPYVVDPRERIQIRGELISRDLFAKLTEHLLRIDSDFEFDGEHGLSEFEFKTALGFAAWHQTGCDWIALEVGLGGRIDATNVVTPTCTVIVSIGLDHVNILGNTLAEIAFEKAGIIKPGIPVVVGEIPPEALDVVLRRAGELASETLVLGRDFQVVRTQIAATVTFRGQEWNIQPGLIGAKQQENAALAAVATTIAGISNSDSIERGISSATLPGRFQVFSFGRKTVIVDGAHNGAAASVLGETLRQQGIERASFIIGMVAGHDPEGFIEPLLPLMHDLQWVPIDFYRANLPQELATITARGESRTSVAEALQSAPGDVIVITGSLYLAGEAIRMLNSGGTCSSYE